MTAYRGDAGAEVEESALASLADEFGSSPDYLVRSSEPLTVHHIDSGREFMLEVRAMPLGSASDG